MLRRSLLALTLLTTIGTAGCFKGGPELGLKILGAVALVAADAAIRSAAHGGGGSCCYVREGATPVEGSVDRPISECELERGRWREANQNEDAPPPRLRCLADGSYPMVSVPYSQPESAEAAPVPSAPQRSEPAQPATPSAPAAPAYPDAI